MKPPEFSLSPLELGEDGDDGRGWGGEFRRALLEVDGEPGLGCGPCSLVGCGTRAYLRYEVSETERDEGDIHTGIQGMFRSI
jgi:hypothetical protein